MDPCPDSYRILSATGHARDKSPPSNGRNERRDHCPTRINPCNRDRNPNARQPETFTMDPEKSLASSGSLRPSCSTQSSPYASTPWPLALLHLSLPPPPESLTLLLTHAYRCLTLTCTPHHPHGGPQPPRSCSSLVWTNVPRSCPSFVPFCEVGPFSGGIGLRCGGVRRKAARPQDSTGRATRVNGECPLLSILTEGNEDCAAPSAPAAPR